MHTYLDNFYGTAIVCFKKPNTQIDLQEGQGAGMSDLTWSTDIELTGICQPRSHPWSSPPTHSPTMAQRARALHHDPLTHGSTTIYPRHHPAFSRRFFMDDHVRLLTFLTTLQECTMDTRWFPLFVSYLDSPHPFGSCSRLVPDDCVLDSLGRAASTVRSEQGPKPSACAAGRKTSRNRSREVFLLSWEGGVSRPASLKMLYR